jgi:predicted CoA-binding protein
MVATDEGWKNPDNEQIDSILKEAKTVAVVGLSSKIDRPSHGVAEFLLERGYDVIPVNPNEKEILGRKSYPNLSSIGRRIDIVDVFRRGEATPPIVREALALDISCVWLQEGVVSQDSYRLAHEAGKPIIMDRCIAKELRRQG